MRYIDIERLERPEGWQDRADEALRELREEIRRAEGEAVASGEDPVGARRATITRVFGRRVRQRVWQDLALNLAVLGNSKCWYSECSNPGSDKNTDHFRPKARVEEDGAHDGYWWLAFEWRNLRYSCQWCNQRRRDIVNSISYGKGNHFPLEAGSLRARGEEGDCNNERRILLDPVDPEDWKLLTFRPDGHPTPARNEGTIEYERARRSIDIYHLHCAEMVKGRKALAARVGRVVGEMERLLPGITQPDQRAVYRSRVGELLELVHRDAEYSAAALAYARNAVVTLTEGGQERREWLETVLDSNP